MKRQAPADRRALVRLAAPGRGADQVLDVDVDVDGAGVEAAGAGAGAAGAAGADAAGVEAFAGVDSVEGASAEAGDDDDE